MGNSKIFQTYKNKNIDWLILTTLLLIILTLFLIKLSNIDVVIQNYFFDFTDKEWLIENILTYNKDLNEKNRFDVTLVQSANKFRNEGRV